jgi:hypothetical protein
MVKAINPVRKTGDREWSNGIVWSLRENRVLARREIHKKEYLQGRVSQGKIFARNIHKELARRLLEAFDS